MKEVEVKILDIERAKVESRLSALGAKLRFDDEISARLRFARRPDRRCPQSVAAPA